VTQDGEGEVTEHEVELEGQIVVCQRRRAMVFPALQDAKGERLPYEATQYSFDCGATWHMTQIDAYREAKDSGSLMTRYADVSEAGEYEAFVVALLGEIGGLEEGERLIVGKSGDALVVMKEQAVLAVRSSTIKDIDLRMQEG